MAGQFQCFQTCKSNLKVVFRQISRGISKRFAKWNLSFTLAVVRKPVVPIDLDCKISVYSVLFLLVSSFFFDTNCYETICVSVIITLQLNTRASSRSHCCNAGSQRCACVISVSLNDVRFTLN